ncbi:PTS sugar transporter subunit IIB [Oceanobacillus sp. FSL W7-1293]|uniref:PTS sugar transporter subunit IIB n=1 Tax=Oceanobacillus TaxID=182709 RepID=UPI0030D3A6F4
MKKVLFVCSGGMSSEIVVNALKKEAGKHGQDLDVKAVGSSEVDAELDHHWDAIMVAPQIRHRFKGIKEKADEHGVPCGSIPAQGYNPLGGPTLLKALNELIS